MSEQTRANEAEKDPLQVASDQINQSVSQLVETGKEYAQMLASRIHKTAQPTASNLVENAVTSSLDRIRNGFQTIMMVIRSQSAAIKSSQEELTKLRTQSEQDTAYIDQLKKQMEAAGLTPNPPMVPVPQAEAPKT